MAGRHYTKLNYCDETDIENFLLLDVSSTFSTQLEDWIAAAEQWVNNYTGYTTASGMWMEAFTNEVSESARVDGDLNLVIFPRKVPIESVSGISLIKGTDSLDLVLTSGGSNKYQIPQPKHCIVYPSSELSLSGTSIIGNFADIKFTRFFCELDYIAGYSVIPADVRLATVNVASEYLMRHANKEGLEMLTQGRITKRWFRRAGGDSDFIHAAKELLGPYRMAGNWF